MKYEPRGAIVTLERFEVAIALLIAQKRTFENRYKPHIYKNYKTLEPQPIAELHGVVCEMAVAKYLDRYWASLAWEAHEHTTYKPNIADVGTDNRIEVRRIKRPDNDLRFWPKDVEGDKTIYIAHCPELSLLPRTTHVDVIAWGDVAEIKRYAKVDDEGAFRVKQEYLHKVTPKKLYAAKPF